MTEWIPKEVDKAKAMAIIWMKEPRKTMEPLK